MEGVLSGGRGFETVQRLMRGCYAGLQLRVGAYSAIVEFLSRKSEKLGLLLRVFLIL